MRIFTRRFGGIDGLNLVQQALPATADRHVLYWVSDCFR
jgi:hypothetical protein